MRICASCGTDNPPGGRFCAGCGEPLAPSSAPSDTRKTVTILFADVVGSTELGERLDAEAVRALMARYFRVARTVIERHGGTLEKFIGDAVMAVFGVPVVHEDDALRAVRAAVELRDAMVALADEVEIRIGVNTGEVMAGDPASGQTFVTGDAVNIAARLQSAAAPGTILLGPATVVLVRDAAELGPAEPLQLKGKSQPLAARQLLAVSGSEGRRRRPDAPLVGRADELAVLLQAWERVTAARAPELITVLAPAGVGKSRLVSEVAARVSLEALVVTGRCLSYGDGITYWPIRQIVHEAVGITEDDEPAAARAKIEAALASERDGDVAARRIASAIGLSDEPAAQEELFWAIRRFLEALARDRPLVVLLEDLHWAEPTLLDLVEYVVDLSSDVPLLVVSTARPELLESRPGWASGRPNARLLRLDPLGAEAADSLLDELPGGTAIPVTLRARLLSAAEGTPLYVEEFVSALRDDGHLREVPGGGWQAHGDLEALPVPPTIQALLASRLGRLPHDERTVVERGSVVGRTFESGVLGVLDPELTSNLGRRLLSLVRKELLRPDRAELTSGDAYRFRHVLIRDVAYAALPKADRARLHERLADWLEEVAGERIAEYEEILGFHLAEAYRFHAELGDAGEPVQRLRRRAVAVLSAAGTRASNRSDYLAAAELLGRADALEPLEPLALLKLADARTATGRLDEAIDAARRAVAGAAERGQADIEQRALLRVLDIRSFGDPEVLTELSAAARDVLSGSGSSGSPQLAAEAWYALAVVAGAHCQWRESASAAEEGITAALAAGDRAAEVRSIKALALALVFGPSACSDAISRCTGILATPLELGLRATVLGSLALLVGMTRPDDEWERASAEARKIIAEAGDSINKWALEAYVGLTFHRRGDDVRAEEILRRSCSALEDMGARFILTSAAGYLADVLVRVGRWSDASKMIEAASQADRDDVEAQVLWRMASARLDLETGMPDEAEAVAREAERRIENTDNTVLRADVAALLVDILDRKGKFADAEAMFARAIALYEDKGAAVLADATRQRRIDRMPHRAIHGAPPG